MPNLPYFSVTGVRKNPNFRVTSRIKNWKPEKHNARFYFNATEKPMPQAQFTPDYSFNDIITDEMINYINQDSNGELVIDTGIEPISQELVSRILRLQSRNIAKDKLVICVQDSIFKKYIEDMLFSAHGFSVSIKVSERHLNVSKKSLPIIESSRLLTRKKFSMTIRNAIDWRAILCYRLYQKGILDNAHASYLVIGEKLNNRPRRVVADLEEFGVPAQDSKDFASQIPLRLEKNDDGDDECHTNVFSALLSSDFNILVETLFHQIGETRRPFDRTWAPSDVSEKTYKTIACKKPFIAFCTPYWLQDLRDILGYRTFSPFIDESYDLEEDEHKRLDMIVAEIDRINTLPEDEYNYVLNNCNQIAEENYKIYLNAIATKLKS